MDQRLQGFFEAAQKQADETTAAQTAAADAETKRLNAQIQNKQVLKAAFDEELGPILDVLKTIPPKNGKRFEVSVNDRSFSSSTEADYSVSVGYKFPRDPHDEYYSSDYDELRPEVGLDIRLENGALEFRITQYSQRQSSGDYRSHKSLRAKDWNEAREQLALGLGSFAADRMAEIGAALGAQAPAATEEPAATSPATVTATATPGIEVFKKPLSLKVNAAAAKAEPPAPPPPANTDTAPAAVTTAEPPKKKKWRLW